MEPELQDANPEIGDRLEKRIKNLETSIQQLTALVEIRHVETFPSEDGSPSASLTVDSHGNPENLDAIESRVDEIASKLSSKIPGPSLSSPDEAFAPSSGSFPFQSFNVDTSALHPTPAQAQTIWQIFKESGDQQVKVVHRPTAESILRQSLKDSTALSNGQTALIFAVYFSAAVSMTAENALQCFKMPKSTAMTVFRSATEQALMRANFLSVGDLTTLQALVLFVAFSQHVDRSQRVWALTGLARRLNPITATTMGTPFEMEMQRRIWWQLWFLDFRATTNEGEDEYLATDAQESELPVNAHDEDLHPDMPIIPPACDGWTPVTFSLLRFTIARTARKVESSISRHNKKILIDECALKVQSTYLRYCNGSEPIHWLALHITYVHITEMRFKLHMQDGQRQLTRADDSSMDRDRLIHAAVDILDVPSRLKNEPDSKKWKWLLNPFPHFTPLSFLLNEISQQQIRPPPAQIWTIAENAFLRAANEMRASKNAQLLSLMMSKAKAGMRGMLEWQELSEKADAGEHARRGTDNPTNIPVDQTFGLDGATFPTFPDFNYASIEELLSFGGMTDLSSTEFPFTYADEQQLGFVDDQQLDFGVGISDDGSQELM